MSGTYITPLKRVFLNLSGGTVTGSTLFTQSVSANTFYSGSTNLYNIFQPIGNTINLPPSQVGFGSSLSGLTGSTGFTYNGQTLKLSGTTNDNIIFQLGQNLLFTDRINGFPDRNGIQVGGLYIHNAAGSSYIQNTGDININTISSKLTYQGDGINLLSGGLKIGSYGVPAYAIDVQGRINSDQLSATTISGGTLYSGNTNLYNIFQAVGTVGSTFLRTGQIGFGSSTSGLTGSTGFTYDGTKLFVSQPTGNTVNVAEIGGFVFKDNIAGFPSRQSLEFAGMQISNFASQPTVFGNGLQMVSNTDLYFIPGSTSKSIFYQGDLQIKKLEGPDTRLATITSDGSLSYLPISSITSGITSTLPSNYIGYGNSLNSLTGSSDFFWEPNQKYILIDSSSIIGRLAGGLYGFQAGGSNAAAFYGANSNGFLRIEVDGTINSQSSSFNNNSLFRSFSISATTISASTIFSGSTNLYDIFQPIGLSGSTTSLQPTQVAYGNSLSALTGSSNFNYNVVTPGSVEYLNAGLITLGNDGSNFGINLSSFGQAVIRNDNSRLTLDRVSGAGGKIKASFLGRTAFDANFSGVTFGETLEIDSTARVDIASGTTAHPSLRIRSGDTYSGNLDGAIWNDSAHLYGIFGGESRQLDNNFVNPTQIAFGNSDSGITSSPNLLFSPAGILYVRRDGTAFVMDQDTVPGYTAFGHYAEGFGILAQDNAVNFYNNGGGIPIARFSLNADGSTIYTNTKIVGKLSSPSITGTTISGATIQSDSLRGASERVVQADYDGTLHAVQEIVSGIVTDPTAIALLTTFSNWNINGVYTGATITNTYQGQFYGDSASTYVFLALADNYFARIPRV